MVTLGLCCAVIELVDLMDPNQWLGQMVSQPDRWLPFFSDGGLDDAADDRFLTGHGQVYL